MNRPEDTASGVVARFRAPGLEDRRFKHKELWDVLAPYVAAETIRVEEIGRSTQGRSIRALHFGKGETKVLLWSQMHGDESTATMALVDIVRFFAEGEGEPLRERLQRNLSITMVPMLNPDGAETWTRRNAIGVDVNRDAGQLATPEARALKALHDRLEPDFGFNLHDQNARTLAGKNGDQVAMALLAPAADEARSYGDARARARLVAATILSILEPKIRGRIAKYDDTFDPRAFGDLMQASGTSTVLIESGALRDDPQKQNVRALNIIAIVEALDAIGTETYRQSDASLYESLPENEEIEHDVILTGGKLLFGGAPPHEVDVGIWFSDPVAREGARLGDVGDLSGTSAIEILDGHGTHDPHRNARRHPRTPGTRRVGDNHGAGRRRHRRAPLRLIRDRAAVRTLPQQLRPPRHSRPSRAGHDFSEAKLPARSEPRDPAPALGRSLQVCTDAAETNKTLLLGRSAHQELDCRVAPSQTPPRCASCIPDRTAQACAHGTTSGRSMCEKGEEKNTWCIPTITLRERAGCAMCNRFEASGTMYRNRVRSWRQENPSGSSIRLRARV